MHQKALLLLDGNSLINRAFYGLFGRQQLTAPDGTPTGALFAFLNMFLRYLDQVDPDYVAVAFDRSEPTRRHQQYADYKGTRKPMPDELAVQLPLLKEILDALGVVRIEKAGYEADDLLGTLAGLASSQEVPVYIVSGDKDSFQLIDDQVTVIWPVTRKGQSELLIYDRKALQEHYQLSPEQFVDFKAIMGDPSDNIPGVKGIGEKGALQLLQEYGTLDAVYSSLDQLRPTQAGKLETSREMAFLSRELARIDRDVPIEKNLADLKRHDLDREQAFRILSRLGLRQMIERLGLEHEARQAADDDRSGTNHVQEAGLAEWQDCLDQLADDAVLALFIDTSGRLFWTVDGKTSYMLPADRLSSAWESLSGRSLRPAVCDYKELLKSWPLKALPQSAHDVLIVGHLLNQVDGRPDLARLYQTVTGQSLLLEGSGEPNWQQPELLSGLQPEADSEKEQENDSADSLRCLAAIYTIAASQQEAIRERQIEQLVYEIELPLAAILAGMEKRGFLIDREVLEQLGKKMDLRLQELQEDIYKQTGRAFNINSPRQLSEVLYQDLGLKPGKKRSGGAYSTDSSELERLQSEHPVIDLIIEHRQTAKLRSTYIEGLTRVIDEADGRVHTTFNQMLTTTGRLSSSEPNLQNIPIRMEAGQQIRQAFVAAPDHLLIDADYSQIELRLLAHLANDPAMIEAFSRDADIHTETACHIFGCSAAEVDTRMRGIAKTMNFSIVYGISDFGLARDLGVPVQAAHQYIHEYDQQYPRIRAYLKEQVSLAYEKGYVETLFGRRRYVHELKSANRNQRQFGERAAMNAPVQGTAADLIKIAMVRVDQALRAEGLSARLILQVHDELIVEAPEKEAEQAAVILRKQMETAMALDVPLRADVKQGRSWADCK